MNKLKRKAVYEAPLTEFFQVELEGGFMAASVEVGADNKTNNGNITEHEVNGNFNATFGDTYTDGSSNWE